MCGRARRRGLREAMKMSWVTPRSHGCIRIDNGPIVWMAQHLPQGTPVQIVG